MRTYDESAGRDSLTKKKKKHQKRNDCILPSAGRVFPPFTTFKDFDEIRVATSQCINTAAVPVNVVFAVFPF